MQCSIQSDNSKTLVGIFSLQLSTCVGNNSSCPSIPVDGPKVTSAIWGPLDYYIIAGHENGTVCQWDSKASGYLNWPRHYEYQSFCLNYTF